LAHELALLKEQADKARILYARNLITREQAKADCTPYITAFNEKATEIARKYNQRPKKISFASFIR
jgi:hypothetical protein